MGSIRGNNLAFSAVSFLANWMLHPEVFVTSSEEHSALTTAGGVIHLNSLVETFTDLGRRANYRSAALICTEDAAWCLRIACNCSLLEG